MQRSIMGIRNVPKILGGAILLGVFLKPGLVLAAESVEISTATGDRIEYRSSTNEAIVTGNARVVNATATLTADELKVNVEENYGEAHGNVKIVGDSATIEGEEGVYYWKSSTGTFHGVRGESPPWFFRGDEMTQVGPRVYYLDDWHFTSCNHDPPHYKLKSSHGKIIQDTRANMENARFVIDELPAFWTPIYSKSLLPKKYTLRIEPGQSSRDGLTNRTIVGYPITPHQHIFVNWDWKQKTGNGGGIEYTYGLQNTSGRFDMDYFRDHNSDPEIPKSREFSLFWNHYQKVTKKLTLNSKIDFKSSQDFGNNVKGVGNGTRVENKERGLLSETGFTYQFDKATFQMDMSRQDKFDDTVSSSNFISNLVLPRLSFNTIPLTLKYFPLKTSFAASWTNQTNTRDDPQQTLKYLRSADASINLQKDLRFTRNLTVVPFGGYQQSWEGQLSTSSTKDLYLGRANTGVNIRQRISRSLDLNSRYNYSVRFKQDKSSIDNGADDYGIEANKVTFGLSSLWGRNNTIRLGSGYDLRNAPRNDPTQYKHSSERWDPISLDVQSEIRPNVTVTFGEIYGIYDSATDRVVRTPINTRGDIQFGTPGGLTFFSQGFNYSKKGSSDQDSTLHLTNKLRFYLTQKWYVDLFLSYRAVGKQKLNYQKIYPDEKTLVVVRDLHCWLLRMEFSERPDRSEASFYIDLKAGARQSKNLFRGEYDQRFYPYRENYPDPVDIFPEPEDDHQSVGPEDTSLEIQ